MKQPWMWAAVGLLIGSALLWYALRGVSGADAVRLLSSADPRHLLAAVTCTLLFMVVKTQRWRILLLPLARVRFAELHGPVYAGAAANVIVSHVGELVRSQLLKNSRELPQSSVIASIGLERVLDMLTMMFIAGLCAFSLESAGASVPARSAAEVAAVLALGACAVVLTAVFYPQRTLLAIDSLLRGIPDKYRVWLQRQLRGALEGFRAVAQPKLISACLALSLAQWTLIAAGIWCSLRALGMDLGLTAPFVTLIVLVLGFTLPTAPGYVGTTQAAFITALGAFHAERDAAFAASLVYTLCVVIPPLLLGALYLLARVRAKSAASAAPSVL